MFVYAEIRLLHLIDRALNRCRVRRVAQEFVCKFRFTDTKYWFDLCKSAFGNGGRLFASQDSPMMQKVRWMRTRASGRCRKRPRSAQEFRKQNSMLMVQAMTLFLQASVRRQYVSD